MCKETELQTVKVCIDTVDTTTKPTGKEIHVVNQRLNSSSAELAVEELARLLVAPHSRTWVPATFKGARSNETWKSQQVFALDFDGGISLEGVKARLKEFGLSCNFVYSTFSSSPTSPKFRVVFVLCEIATNKALRDQIISALLRLFPEADKSCKDPARMFFGGIAILFHDFPYRLNPKELVIAADVYYLNGVSKNTKTERLKKLGKNGRSINTIIESSKNPRIEEVRDFDYEIAAREVKIFNDFMHSEWLTHPQLFGIATNLVHIKGGLRFMKQTMDATGKYTLNNYNILPYVRKQKYYPQQLCNFSPYEEDFQHRNIIDAGKLPRGAVRRTRPFITISLEEGERKLREAFKEVQKCKDQKIHVICAPTAIGKTEVITLLDNSFIGFPDHALKNEVGERMKVDHALTPDLMQYLSKGDKEFVLHCYKVGAYRKASSYIKNKRPASKGYNATPDEREYGGYYRDLSNALTCDGSVLTTHAKLQRIDLKGKVIYYDEDPLTTSFLTMHEAHLADIKALMFGIKDPADRSIITNLIDIVAHASHNTLIDMPEFAFNDYTEIENLAVRNKDMLGNILDFLNCEYFLIDSKDSTKLHFIRMWLPPEERQIIILSATANEWIYKQLFGDRVIFHYVDQVELKGTLVQDTSYSFSRQNLQKNPEVIKYALEKVADRMVITFQKFTHDFKNAYKDIYFGNCQGKDGFQDKPLAIIGTPHVSPAVYFLYSKYLGLDFKPEDFRQEMHAVHRNGLYFNFYTFNDERLRTLQFYFIERELRQAIGRGRPIRRPDADILVLSNYPLPEATQLRELL